MASGYSIGHQLCSTTHTDANTWPKYMPCVSSGQGSSHALMQGMGVLIDVTDCLPIHYAGPASLRLHPS
eukprot:1159211-Pelagomonas_calceolata.AAC.1